MDNLDVLEKRGKRVVLLGNEAIVRGALEAGLGLGASYPGTPSSEVGMTLAAIAKKVGIYFEWSSNEKVAFEVGAGAAFCGVKALVSMKHFGLNVASDSVFPVVYTGIRGGLVLMVADDPGGYSSAQSEEDSRYFSRIGYLPTLEPSDVQECKDFTKLAFEISRKYEIPVMLRTTTRVSHAFGTVKLGGMKKGKGKGAFEKEKRYFNLRPGLQELHGKVWGKIESIEKEYGKLNKVEGEGRIGIITNGVSYQYVKELNLDWKKIKIAKINLTYPLSKEFFSEFIRGLDRVIVVEEGEPIIEGFVKEVGKEVNPKLRIKGKGILPRVGEFSPDLVLEKIGPILGMGVGKKKGIKISLPIRNPTLCAGCPHRSTFYALKKVLGEEVIWAGDIGCYMLGVYEPFKMEDFFISMGGGEGIAQGIKKVSGQRVVAFIGDSTFFHAGIPALINMKVNGFKGIVVILNNDITAMTGHQPHPASGFNAVGERVEGVKIKGLVEGLGIRKVKEISAFNQRELEEGVKELVGKEELGVLIASGECRLVTKRKLRREGKKFLIYEINTDKCIKCGTCLDRFACPAVFEEEGKIKINPDLCWGCGVCAQICPAGAIRVKK